MDRFDGHAMLWDFGDEQELNARFGFELAGPVNRTTGHQEKVRFWVGDINGRHPPTILESSHIQDVRTAYKLVAAFRVEQHKARKIFRNPKPPRRGGGNNRRRCPECAGTLYIETGDGFTQPCPLCASRAHRRGR